MRKEKFDFLFLFLGDVWSFEIHFMFLSFSLFSFFFSSFLAYFFFLFSFLFSSFCSLSFGVSVDFLSQTLSSSVWFSLLLFRFFAFLLVFLFIFENTFILKYYLSTKQFESEQNPKRRQTIHEQYKNKIARKEQSK